MANEANHASDGTYASLLERFCLTKDAGLLAEAAILSEGFIGANVGPMDIKAIHDAAVSKLIDPNDFDALVAAHRVLLEVLVAYGMAFSVISERLLAEADASASLEQLRSEDADRVGQERLARLAGVSHELGNPLMVVKINVASIRRFLEERDSWPEELDQREEDVETAVGRMLALREELLAASRDERRELEIVPLHLERILRRAVRWGGFQASQKGIVLTEDCPSDLPYVMGDDGAVQSILTNLLSNAIRYTEPEGSVSVTARHEGSRVIVQVADTGMGISEEDQLRIYERFYRTDEAKKAVSVGIGLGLAITRDLVSALAGTIELSSQIGRGSIFEVSLPASSPIAEGCLQLAEAAPASPLGSCL